MLFDLFYKRISPLYFIFFIISLLISLTLHELAHAYTSYKLGDSTAKQDGRISLNPLNHIDPYGFLAILIIGFGWAKPVMMNPYNFRNYRDGIFLTALAGPASNFLLAIMGMLIFNFNLPIIFKEFVGVFISINIILASFNILPIPPLDGYKVFSRILSDKLFFKAEYYERRYGFIILMVLLISGILQTVWLPVYNFLYSIVSLFRF
ncbi:MAG: site-2 protease family protein [Firmicutes bacterium]|nr:site-2 protease family protein [Bacillota bacterium]